MLCAHLLSCCTYVVCLSSQAHNGLLSLFFSFLFCSFFKRAIVCSFCNYLSSNHYYMWIQVKTLFTTFLKLQSNHLQLPNTVHFNLWPSQRASLNLVLLFISEGSSSIQTCNTLKSKDRNKKLLSMSVIPLQILHSLKIACLETEACHLLCMPSYLNLFLLRSWIFLIIEVLMLPWWSLHLSKERILLVLDKGNQTCGNISLNSPPA